MKNVTAVPWQPVQRSLFQVLLHGWGLKVWRCDGSELQSLHEETLSEPCPSFEIKVTVLQGTEDTYLYYSCAWERKDRLRPRQRRTEKKPRFSTYKMVLVRVPVVPWCWGGEWLFLIGSIISSSGIGSSSRLGSLWVEVSFSWTQGSGQLISSGGLFEWRRSSGSCGLCSMVSCSGLLVSWITQFI